MNIQLALLINSTTSLFPIKSYIKLDVPFSNSCLIKYNFKKLITVSTIKESKENDKKYEIVHSFDLSFPIKAAITYIT